MDLIKAKIYLDKITREFGRMTKDPENIPRIDVDITLSYVRELYDAFLSDAPEAAKPAPAPRKVAPPVVEAPPPPPVVVAPPPVVVAPPPPPPVEVPPPPPVVVAPPPPPVEVAPPPPVVVAPPPPPVVVAPPPVVEAPPPPPVVVAPPPPAPAAVAVNADAAEVLFEYKEAKELSEKLSDTPIADLKRAISLNDRLMIQRELFGNDHPAFESALSTLNGASGFEAARAYLLQECIGRFDWLHKNRLETAKAFIRLVRRRYK